MNYKDWSGYRYHKCLPATVVVVVDGFEQGLESPDDKDAPRWFTICGAHGSCCGHYTLVAAKDFAHAPQEWCEDCAS